MADDQVILDNFDEIPDNDEGGFIEGERILAEDDYYKLSARRLELKQYFFPSKKPRHISVWEIKSIYFKQQSMADLILTKMWGMHGLKVWWARDIKRGIRGMSRTDSYNVVVDCGERTMKGFTVTNFENFRSGLQQFNTSITYFVDKLPQIF